MLLLLDEGKTLVEIAAKVDFHFSAVKLCLKKYRKGGIESALNDEKGRGRKAKITDEDKIWVTIHHKKFTKNRRYPLFKEIQM